MVRLTLNPFKQRTVPHYTYEYLDIHGNVKRGPFSFTEPIRAAAEGHRQATLYGSFPIQMRVVDERGEIVDPPEFTERFKQSETPLRLSFTKQELVEALDEAQEAHHAHEREELSKVRDEEPAVRLARAKELAAAWKAWYVDFIFDHLHDHEHETDHAAVEAELK